MRREGVPVGLGVDGSASNDSGHMLKRSAPSDAAPARRFRPDAMTARDALEIATLGGARVLNRDDIGALKPGMAADSSRSISIRSALPASMIRLPR